MSLLPAKFDFTIWKGATFRKQLVLRTGGPDSPLRNLTGYTSELVIRPEAEGAALLTLTTANGKIILGGVNGTIDLVIDAATTAAITWPSGVYDLTITAPGGSGETDALLYGGFKVRGV